jgi:hypothetical protein
MHCRPPPSRPFVEILVAVRTLSTPDDPRRHVIREMSSVPFVIERELFDRPVPGV